MEQKPSEIRPVYSWTAEDLLQLANKLEQQGFFAVMDIQESNDKKGDHIEENRHRIGVMKTVVADCIRFVAEMKIQAKEVVDSIHEMVQKQ